MERYPGSSISAGMARMYLGRHAHARVCDAGSLHASQVATQDSGHEIGWRRLLETRQIGDDQPCGLKQGVQSQPCGAILCRTASVENELEAKVARAMRIEQLSVFLRLRTPGNEQGSQPASHLSQVPKIYQSMTKQLILFPPVTVASVSQALG
jgi:hypothetical protein